MATVTFMTQKKKQAEMPPIFIAGYLTDLFEAGKQPNYGYPTNGLPETTDDDMDVVTGYLAPRPPSKK